MFWDYEKANWRVGMVTAFMSIFRRLNFHRPCNPSIQQKMLNTKAVFLALLLVAASFAAQLPPPPSPQVEALIANDPNVLTVLNNHFGCAQWEGNNCLKCSVNYYFNTKGICCKVHPQCKVFNQDVGICEQCYEGYALSNGTCTIIAPGAQVNPGCQSWDGNGNCLKCSVRFFPNADNICTPVSDKCRIWDEQTGECTACYAGYVVDQGQCVRDPNPFIPAANSLCKTFDNNQVCLECADRSFFNADNVCVAVSDYCNTWDALTGACLTCPVGFALQEGQCNIAPGVKPADLGCKIWDWNNQACLSCSFNFVFNQNNICVPVSDQCKEHDAAGACTACFFGYDLKAGSCVFSETNNARPSDLGCADWDWNNNKCLSCSNWYFFNVDGVCVPVSDLCATYDSATGNCASCFKGFSLDQGICQPSAPVKPADAGCGAWDWENKVCLSCSKNWVFVNNLCVPVSDQCATFDVNGDCLTCYQGYNLEGGKCIIQDLTLVIPADKGCSDWNWADQICLTCSKNWFMSPDGVCIPVDDLCKTSDPNGRCLSCYVGYDLVNGVCEFSAFNNAKPSDLGCSKWDWANQVCLECSKEWVFNADGACVPVSDQCKSHDTNGLCTSCFAGYDLVDGTCVFGAINTAKPSDSGCGKWDWNNQVCLECSAQWTFNADKVCVPVSDLCASHDANGACLSCFKGYDLVNGVCEFSAFNNAKPSDLGCGKWDWNNQVCLECSKDWTFNADSVCVPVSDLCASHDASGACTSCFNGYDLVNGVCEFSSFNNAKPSDKGCGKWDWANQVCLECSAQWTFNADKVCVPVSDLCASHDAAGACLSCFKGYDLVNGVCEFSAFNNAKPSDLGCAKWDWNNQVCLECSAQWTFNAEGVCVPVSDLCAAHDANGACTACFQGYDLVDGVCEFSSFNNAKPSDSGCADWDWNNQVCLACSKGWTFNADSVCTPVSDLCASHDASGACTSCFKGYELVNGVCEFSAFNTAKPSDLGCAKWDWDNQVCLECSAKWTFNADKVCVPVSDQCKEHDAAGACTACFQGYDLVNGACEFSSFNNAKPSDSGCAKWDWNNQVCLECSKEWVFNADGVCVTVSDQCASHDANGACLSCFKGYDLVNGVCEFSSFNNAKPSDSGCASWDWDNQVCLACSKHWVFNADKVCVPVSDQCKTHDEAGICLTCYQGYDLVEGACVFSSFNNAKPSDSGCGKWDWNNQVCLECSSGWVFNADKVCVPVSDLCASHDASGACLSCFKGYDLVNGVCEFSSFNNAKPSDLGCSSWDWDNQVCLTCSKNWVFNADNVCVPVSDHCASHDAAGLCLTCYQGYDLVNGACEFSAFNTAKPSDSGCADWDWNNQVCLACSKDWVFNADKICVPVSDQCASHDAAGLCLTCYKGYDLVEGACVFSSFNNAKPSDAGCASWDWDNQVCLACSKDWVFNADKLCVPVSDQCKEHDAAGACTSCYQGYDLVEGACVFSSFNNAKPSDSGCGKWDWNNQVCLECSSGWVFNADGVCVTVSDQCASHDASGACLSCFKGYDLVNGVCEFSSFNNAKPSDLGCSSWDWDNQVCLKCSNNWVFNADKVCVPVSDQCKAHDAAGLCTACYKGYDLVDGACVFSSFNNAKPSDPGCKTWDWDNQVCLECSNRWVFNADKVCVPVNDYCSSYDSATGACTSCFAGYLLSNGACDLANPLCKSSTESGACASCYTGYINVNGVCTPISKLASLYLYYAECCPEKLAQLKAAAAKP